MIGHRPVTEELLISRTRITANGCWEWTWGRFTTGYGQVSRDGRPTYAHRAIIELRNGPLAKNQVVMHTCDNPPCINPDHLVVTDQSANVRDMFEKKRDGRSTLPSTRWPRGSQVVTAKLSEADVGRIKGLLRAGKSLRTIGAAFGVSHRTVLFIAQGITWRHVD